MLSLIMTLSSAFCLGFGASAATVDLGSVGADVSLAETSVSAYGLCDDVQDGQILQCWCWSFDNIRKMLPKIAAQGFTAVQTSPIQPVKESTKESWSTFMGQCWVVYQPVAFNIEDNYRNAFGTKKEFEAMCAEAEKYGIKVIVDTVFNHMANDMTENTIHPWIPSEIRNDSNCWHDISKNIYDFDNRYDTTHYCLTGLPDLNTANATVQKHCTNFLKECIDAGADGFRFDAVKHIETPDDASGTKSDFWPNVLNAATEYAQETKGFTPYYYGELLGTPGQGLSTSAYTKYMSVTDTGANDIRQAVVDGNASRAASSGISNGAAPSKTVQWTESHDNFKDDGTRFISDENINKTWAIVGARNEVCGLYLARPENMDTTMLGDADVTSWASTEVRAVNKFKNLFVGKSEYMASSGNIAYIERGDSGIVLVNTKGMYYNNMSVPVHRMASGTYTDAITGNTFTVSDGYISGDMGDTGIAVVYNVEEAGTLTKGSPTAYSLAGTFNDWDTDANVMAAKDSAVATTTMILEKGEYTFKINNDNLWFSNKGTIEDSTGESGWTFDPSVSDKCTLKASGGKYTFSFNTTTRKLTVTHSDDTDSDVYIKGEFNDWSSSAQMEYVKDGNVVETTLSIPKGTYSFKVHNRGIGSWYSNTGTVEDTTGDTGWTMRTTVDDNCTLIASGGTYKFSFNLSNNKLTITADISQVVTTIPETTPAETTAEATTSPKAENEASPYYVKGEFNNWKDTNPLYFTDDGDILSATFDIEAGTYTFKLHKTDTDKWYGNTGTIEDTTGDKGWTMKEGADKCTLEASGGTYTFTLARSTKKLTVHYTPYEEETTAAETTAPAETGSQIFLRGDFNDWTSENEMTAQTKENLLVTELELEEGTYLFKIQDKGKSRWYGNDGTIKDSTDGSWSMHQSEGDVTLEASGGTYTFIFDTDERRLTVNHVPAGGDAGIPEIPVLEEFTVTFKDFDGTVIDTQTVLEGSAATPPADLVREGTAEYSYVFTGWDKSFVVITEDTEITATYEQKINEYEVKFLDFDGRLLDLQTVPYGGDAKAPAEPSRFGYKFKAWDKAFENITEDVTVTAVYEKLPAFSVTWAESDAYAVVSEIDPSSVPSGEDFSFKVQVSEGYSLDGVVAGMKLLTADENGVYTIPAVSEDTKIIIVTTKKEATPEAMTFTVTFTDKDGKILDEQEVKYGMPALAPTAPEVDGYTFTGWSEEYDFVTKDITVTAEYKKNVTPPAPATTGKLQIKVTGGTSFTIAIDGGVARPQGASYMNTKAPLNKVVTVVATATNGAEFIGWMNATTGSIVSASETYTFTTSGNDFFEAVYKTDVTGANLVVFKNDKANNGLGQILDMQTYVAGDEITFPAEPGQAGYVFAGWNMTEADIQASLAAGEDVTVLATWNVREVYVTVTVDGGTVTGGTPNADGQFKANSAVTVTADAAAEGMKFAYWVDDAGKVKSYDATYKFFPAVDTTVKAVYVESDAAVDYKVLVDIAADPSVDGAKVAFTYTWNVPAESGNTFVKAGIILVNKDNYNAETFYHGTADGNVTDYAPGQTVQISANTWTTNKSGINPGDTWIGACWVIYTDADGVEQTVYSDLVEVTKY